MRHQRRQGQDSKNPELVHTFFIVFVLLFFERIAFFFLTGANYYESRRCVTRLFSTSYGRRGGRAP
jgi:hypothetical protein